MSIISRLKEEIAIIRQRDPAIHSAMEVFLYPSFKVTAWPTSYIGRSIISLPDGYPKEGCARLG